MRPSCTRSMAKRFSFSRLKPGAGLRAKTGADWCGRGPQVSLRAPHGGASAAGHVDCHGVAGIGLQGSDTGGVVARASIGGRGARRAVAKAYCGKRKEEVWIRNEGEGDGGHGIGRRRQRNSRADRSAGKRVSRGQVQHVGLGETDASWKAGRGSGPPRGNPPCWTTGRAVFGIEGASLAVLAACLRRRGRKKSGTAMCLRGTGRVRPAPAWQPMRRLLLARAMKQRRAMRWRGRQVQVRRRDPGRPWRDSRVAGNDRLTKNLGLESRRY